MIKLIKYSTENFALWNDFVALSKNGTFLLNRNFMDYHSDRFHDNSLMFFKDTKLVALLPANLDQSSSSLHSHQGLSYGGLLLSQNTRLQDVLEIFESLKEYCKNHAISKLIYKRIPHIYSKYPNDEDLYALFRHDAKLIRRDAGFAIDMKNQLPLNHSHKQNLRKSLQHNLICKVSKDYSQYHKILSEVLSISHNTKPTHSQSEMELLANMFPQNIELICSYKDEEMVSGIWLFIEHDIIHTQYIASSDEGKNCGGVAAIVKYILEKFPEKKYLSFGISTENSGRYLNDGLAKQKEGFGARTICHDFYELNFSS